ncbi:MAG: L-aspartate oxidase [Bacteroidota bacterium]
MVIRSDFLILGSGIAGLSFALKAAELGTVALITKKERAESNTNYAQGGVAAVTADDDSYDLHLEDTLNAGVGLCHHDAVEILVREGPLRLKELQELGVQFTQKNGSLDLGKEGGHSRNRIVHAHDRSGWEIERALLHQVDHHKNITVYENHLAIDLITEHHLGVPISKMSPIHCWGAYVLEVVNKSVDIFLAKKTILCTGGAGQVYRHTTNPPIATGDGIAMAYRAGADIGNMEFIQFHPTTLYQSGSPAFLISEAVRGFGGILKTQSGNTFMEGYDPRGSLAPRDIVARAIDTELKKSGDRYVLLDLRHLPASEVMDHFPHIYKTCLQKYKLDITKEPIPVVPAAHYSCGGVVTDLNGRTSIVNLYACGEVSMTGVHGANRLASNSLLEAMVFSHRAFDDVKKTISVTDSDIPVIPPWDESGTFNAEEWILMSHDKRVIQEIMWDYVGIVRSNIRLERALRRIQLITDEIEDFYKRTKVVEDLVELRNIATVAKLIVRCALRRKESRGLHYTTDYLQRDDKYFLHDTLISLWDA